MKKTFVNCLAVLLNLFLIPAGIYAQNNNVADSDYSIFQNSMFLVLFSLILILLLVIVALGEVIKAAGKNKNETNNQHNNAVLKSIIAIVCFVGLANSAVAQSDATGLLKISFGGLESVTFYSLISILFVEVIIVAIMFNIAMKLLKNKTEEESNVEIEASPKPSLIEKLNESVAIEDEHEIMFDHEYDGIRELDNNLPPWWKYGFYLTIVFGLVYLVHFHITRTGKLQAEEYNEQVRIAKTEIEEYKRKAADLVDENSVEFIKDEAVLNNGKEIYMTNCSPCHGKLGEGGVGPNFADNYWIHGGGIKDIFKTVKYGYPEKGMKSWEADLGAKQMQDVSCYIKTLVGTNPPNQKAQQGELYSEINEAIIDSTNLTVNANVVDTVNVDSVIKNK